MRAYVCTAYGDPSVLQLTSHLELVESLGADAVLDYTKQDALDPVARFDFVFDAVGRAKTSKLKEAGRGALSPLGK